MFVAATTALTSAVGFAAEPAYLNAKDAGPDFEVQGEYAGPDDAGKKWGLQVIALGEHKFDGVLYAGGLPGAGWDGKTRLKVTGQTNGATTALSSDDADLTIAGTAVAVTIKRPTAGSATLKKVQRESPTLNAKPPAGAVVLFDGSSVEGWQNGQLTDDKLLGVGTRTKDVFGNFTLHLEFRTPFQPTARGQGRGNSGMYLQDQYECQVLDSFGLEGADNECGGIYSNSKPLVNMCLPPLSWQTYDVEFKTAVVNDAGEITSPAVCSIRHNGVLIHDKLALKTTPGGGKQDGKPGALYLQDHGDPVRFRNIWIVKH